MTCLPSATHCCCSDIESIVVPRWVADNSEGKSRLSVVVSLSVVIKCRALGWSSAQTDSALNLMTKVLAEDPRSRRSRTVHSHGLFAHEMKIHDASIIVRPFLRSVLGAFRDFSLFDLHALLIPCSCIRLQLVYRFDNEIIFMSILPKLELPGLLLCTLSNETATPAYTNDSLTLNCSLRSPQMHRALLEYFRRLQIPLS